MFWYFQSAPRTAAGTALKFIGCLRSAIPPNCDVLFIVILFVTKFADRAKQLLRAKFQLKINVTMNRWADILLSPTKAASSATNKWGFNKASNLSCQKRFVTEVLRRLKRKFVITVIVWHINRNIIVSLMAPENYSTSMVKTSFSSFFLFSMLCLDSALMWFSSFVKKIPRQKHCQMCMKLDQHFNHYARQLLHNKLLSPLASLSLLHDSSLFSHEDILQNETQTAR